MRYQVIFSDMDGTLLDSRHRISPRTRAAVRAYGAAGGRFVLVSARPPQAMLVYQAQLPDADRVSLNGALIHNARGEPIHSVTIPEADLLRLRRELVGLADVVVNYYPGLTWYSEQPEHPYTLQERAITGIETRRAPKTLHGVHKMMLRGTPARCSALENRLRRRYPGLSLCTSQPGFLELFSKGADKGKAAAYLAERYGIARESTLAFGDNYNDLPMLEYAGLAVAMGNAPTAVSAAADRQTLDHDADGVAVVLEELLDP